MKIKFLGASGTVTGSSYVLTSGSGQSLLVDLGMFQGLPDIEKLNYEPFAYDCGQLSGALLTHAHLDHCGRLPIMLKQGFSGNIWMTPPTADLVALSLADSAKIAKMDNRPVLYNQIQVEKTISLFKTVNYGNPVRVSDFSVTFRDAGHILGSACLEIEDLTPDSQYKKIIFSGDLGKTPADLLRTTEKLDDSDAVVIESTYGDSFHSRDNPAEVIKSEINLVETSGGTLLIPSFSLDRAQEILHHIMHLKKDGKVNNRTPVFLDSPMAQKATDIYMKYPHYFNAHLQTEFKLGCPFDFPGLETAYKRQESEAIQARKGPKVIIAGSGMMTGGRIVDHAAHFLPISSTRLLLVGYQAEDTLGQHLQLGERVVDIEGVRITVNGTVSDTSCMSSHADQGQLLNWLKNIKSVKKVFVTHGDDTPREILAQKINSDLHISDVIRPLQNQEFKF